MLSCTRITFHQAFFTYCILSLMASCVFSWRFNACQNLELIVAPMRSRSICSYILSNTTWTRECLPTRNFMLGEIFHLPYMSKRLPLVFHIYSFSMMAKIRMPIPWRKQLKVKLLSTHSKWTCQTTWHLTHKNCNCERIMYRHTSILLFVRDCKN